MTQKDRIFRKVKRSKLKIFQMIWIRPVANRVSARIGKRFIKTPRGLWALDIHKGHLVIQWAIYHWGELTTLTTCLHLVDCLLSAVWIYTLFLSFSCFLSIWTIIWIFAEKLSFLFGGEPWKLYRFWYIADFTKIHMQVSSLLRSNKLSPRLTMLVGFRNVNWFCPSIALSRRNLRHANKIKDQNMKVPFRQTGSLHIVLIKVVTGLFSIFWYKPLENYLRRNRQLHARNARLDKCV